MKDALERSEGWGVGGEGWSFLRDGRRGGKSNLWLMADRDKSRYAKEKNVRRFRQQSGTRKEDGKCSLGKGAGQA